MECGTATTLLINSNVQTPSERRIACVRCVFDRSIYHGRNADTAADISRVALRLPLAALSGCLSQSNPIKKSCDLLVSSTAFENFPVGGVACGMLLTILSKVTNSLWAFSLVGVDLEADEIWRVVGEGEVEGAREKGSWLKEEISSLRRGPTSDRLQRYRQFLLAAA